MYLITAIQELLPEGAQARRISEDVVNILAPGRDLTKEDADAARMAIAAAGYTEVKSWIATEGMSWLSSGIQSASFKVQRDPFVHEQALHENWARDQVTAAGKSWATHMVKFDGTVLER
jgi:hypothetical protein